MSEEKKEKIIQENMEISEASNTLCSTLLIKQINSLHSLVLPNYHRLHRFSNK